MPTTAARGHGRPMVVRDIRTRATGTSAPQHSLHGAPLVRAWRTSLHVLTGAVLSAILLSWR